MAYVTGLADFNTPCTISTEPENISDVDVLLVAVKTYDLDEALSSVAHINFSSFLSVQNGVQFDESLALVFGQPNTVGSSANFIGEVLANGDARFTVNGGFIIRELPDGVSDRVQELVSMLQDYGINSEAVPNIRSLQRPKFAVWAAGTPLAVFTRLETHKFFSDPDCALVFMRLLREIGKIAAEKNIPLVDRGPLPPEGYSAGRKKKPCPWYKSSAFTLKRMPRTTGCFPHKTWSRGPGSGLTKLWATRLQRPRNWEFPSQRSKSVTASFSELTEISEPDASVTLFNH